MEAEGEAGSASFAENIAMPFTLPVEGAQITSEGTLNTYTIGYFVGEGSFGAVYNCSDVWGNELVAKILKPNGQDNTLVLQRARSERDAMVHVRHPNIVHVHDTFVYQGAFYIISERCQLTLLDMFQNPNLNMRLWFMPIARCLLQAVHFAHVQNLVHCDIHPGNIFTRLIRDEMRGKETATTFKLGDFGLARTSDAVDPCGTFLDSIRPPEAISPHEFGPADSRVDIYHLGLVLLQVYLGETLTFTRDEILAGKPRELALGLPAPISFALEKMLRRRVMYRTATALEAWRDLNSPVDAS